MSDSVAPLPALSIDLYDQPGHLIRRAQQISVSVFHETVGRHITPVQYAALRVIEAKPGLDQITLADEIALDTSTTADMAVRLESKGWIVREVVARRQRSLQITDEGRKILDETVHGIHALQQVLLSNLDELEQREFMRLLRKFVRLGNDLSRAPLRLHEKTTEAPQA